MRGIRTITAVICLPVSISAEKPDWEKVSSLLLNHFYEENEATVTYDFQIDDDFEAITVRTEEDTFRMLSLPAADMYDFTDMKGVMTFDEGVSEVQDTYAILQSKAQELVYLLDLAIETWDVPLPAKITIDYASQDGGERIQINPGDHIRYKRPWKLTGSLSGIDPVTFHLRQVFGKDNKGLVLTGHISFSENRVDINESESINDWLVLIGMRSEWNEEKGDWDCFPIADPQGNYLTIGDVMRIVPSDQSSDSASESEDSIRE